MAGSVNNKFLIYWWLFKSRKVLRFVRCIKTISSLEAVASCLSILLSSSFLNVQWSAETTFPAACRSTQPFQMSCANQLQLFHLVYMPLIQSNTWQLIGETAQPSRQWFKKQHMAVFWTLSLLSVCNRLTVEKQGHLWLPSKMPAHKQPCHYNVHECSCTTAHYIVTNLPPRWSVCGAI